MADESDAAVAAALALDPPAAHFLLSSVAHAAFSSRFASALSPVPAAAFFADAYGEPRILALRAALASLPPPSSLASPAAVASLPRPSRALLADVLLRNGELRVRSCGRHGTAVALRAAGTARPRALRVWHGSHVRNFWSITVGGLRVFPNDAAHVETGRAFGDGCYCAESLETASSFSGVATGRAGLGDGWRCVRKATCEVGVSSLDGLVRGGDQTAGGVCPEGYVVVRREESLHVEGLVVEFFGERRKSSVASEDDGWRGGACVALALAVFFAVFGGAEWFLRMAQVWGVQGR